ncbi:Uba52-like protein [Cladobotryum mycophilum]|uniref:Uba52-like protein n=1 Tax=Cladobotryum mycophilum TaxID=491253 RepID=A0ABR0SWL1_9HYPO
MVQTVKVVLTSHVWVLSFQRKVFNMQLDLTSWSPEVKLSSESIRLDDLEISFHRTVRVPDNSSMNELPPSLGQFPLFSVNCYTEKLPNSMSRRGGLFFPMYRKSSREKNGRPCGFNFDSCKRYAIKILVGGINVVSSEPVIETAATALRRRDLPKSRKKMVGCIAVEPGKVRQFVSMPMGTGYSVEAQIMGDETTGGMQFEITRLDTPYPRTKMGERIKIKIVTLTRKTIIFQAYPSNTIAEVKEYVQNQEGIPPDQQKLVFCGQQLEDWSTLSDYEIQDGDEIDLILSLRGSGYLDPAKLQMSVAAGGQIKQNIVNLPRRDYQNSTTIAFQVQILNSAHFRFITSQEPPRCPISAKDYAALGLPFFSPYEEPTTLCGDFSTMRSMNHIDGAEETSLKDIPIMGTKTGYLIEWTSTNCKLLNRHSM